ncbi:hypothetical protein ACS0TY_024038 [Phlomoides rotata]
MGEQVTLFLSVLSHHSKVRIVKFNFKRSAQTIHYYFHNILRAILKLHNILLAKPTPVDDDALILAGNISRYISKSDASLHGCLGALDGTLIDVMVPEIDKARYRTRKGTVPVNVLAGCDRRMHFIYMLTGWDGSAADARVLRDALTRDDGFKVPQGKFYLCDNGLILACALIHNFIRNEMPNDPLEKELIPENPTQLHEEEFIDSVNPSHAWSTWRDTLASEMPSLLFSDFCNLNMFTCNTGLMEGVTTDQVMEKLRNRNDKGCRGWSIREEQVLSKAMKKIVREGWKSENGFKSGYLNLSGFND